MRPVLISYELVATDEGSESFKRLLAAIRSYPGGAQVQDRLWIVLTDETREQVARTAWAHLQPTDRLFIAALADGAAWASPICENPWLEHNLFRDDTPTEKLQKA